MRKSPLGPLGCESYRLCQKGVIPLLRKGRLGGILQINAVMTMRLLIKSLLSTCSAALETKFTRGSVF